MSLRDRALRQAHDANIRAHARPQSLPAQRDGTGVRIGANLVRANPVTNEPLGTGDGVVVSRDGLATQERRKVSRAVEPAQSLGKVGRVKILIYVVKNGGRDFYVGGHTKSPLFIKSCSNSTIGTLENIGRGKNDYIFAYQDSNAGVVGVIYGADSSKNWELTDSRAAYLRYRGDGFWSSNEQSIPQFPQTPQSLAPTVYRSIQNTLTPKEELGRFVCAQTGIVSNCLAWDFVGLREVEELDISVRQGMPAAFDNTLFAGATNEARYEVRDTDYWQGNYGGGSEPTFPGLPGDLVDPSEPDIAWQIDTNAVIRYRDTAIAYRNLDAPTFGFSAYQGQITAQSGSQKINYSRDQFSLLAATWDSKFSYLMFPAKRGSAEGFYVWSISLGGTDPISEPGVSSNTFSYEYSKTVPMFISPTIQKQNTDFFLDSSSSSTPFTSTSYAVRSTFQGGVLWSEFTASGGASLPTYDVIPTILMNQFANKFIFQFNGQENQISRIPPGTVRQIDNEDFPSFVAVEKSQLEGNPNAGEPSIFESQINAEVFICRRVGADFQPDNAREKRDERVYKVSLPENDSQIVLADYF